MGSLKALQEWCRIQCEGYDEVDVKNMSSAFRDGLAFCAIIHRFRPDLIDFSSLSKENVYENNRLAFEVAEAQLGIPALLDPEDMLSMMVPDRLSIITYVSQYYNFFTNKSQATPPCMKRPVGSGQNQSAQKRFMGPLEDKAVESEPAQMGLEADLRLRCSTLSSTCTACLKHVHLVQRFLVDGKLYHRNCFRCRECSSTLLPGSYRTGKESGSLICTHHFTRPALANQNGRPDLSKSPVEVQSARIGRSPSHQDPPSVSDQEINSVVYRDELTSDSLTDDTPAATQSDSLIIVEEPSTPPNPFDESDDDGGPAHITLPTAGNQSIDTPKSKDPPWLALVQSEPKKKPAPPPPAGLATPPHAGITQTTTTEAGAADTAPSGGSSSRSASPSGGKGKKRPAPRAPQAPSATQVAPYSQPSSCSPSPALSIESLWSGSEHPFTKSVSEPSISGPSAPAASPSSCSDERLPRLSLSPSPPATPANTSSAPATPQTNRSSGVRAPRHPPPPRPPLATPSPLATETSPANSKRTCKENPFNKKASPSHANAKTRPPCGPRPARPPAPGHGFPLIKRKVQSDQYIPAEDIHGEMSQLEQQLDQLEQRGVELESKLRDNPSDEEEERLLVEWFTLIHDKHLLVRREAELVYTVKQQNLEERQADVEYELRCLLNKPEKDWSEEDRSREQELMADLVTIIEQRNQIINNMDQDRQRCYIVLMNSLSLSLSHTHS
ncbi:hypothetical protein NHX12_018552 [Muraenolepis orangiensis]|uniref:MICAL-like 1 n=1 Tax=Muraenolepis orangiensis TaxID=630683 RepID=A0A9Q0IYK4_9TELE|nr:hypothetical protein NHX12_018552 [Muraenolepis orangiensis]